MSTTPINNNVAMENVRPRPDVRQKVTGAAKYTADMQPKNLVYAAYVRFPYGEGKVTKSDVERAKKIPGIIEVEVGTKDLKYPGARGGTIVAESRAAIFDAMDALGLEFEIKKPRTEPMKQYDGPPAADVEKTAQLDEMFKKATHVVEATYTTQVQTHSALEPHGAVIDHKGDSVDAWVSTQALMGCQGALEGICEVPASNITVHCEYVGGGFGAKFSPGPEGGLAARVSKQYKRPCKVILNRREEHLDGGNRPGSIQYMKMAVDAAGKILGGRIHIANICGWQPGRAGVHNPSYYDFGNIERTEQDIALSSRLPEAFRAPGFPQGAFAVESMMDELSAVSGIDPVELRILNETSERRKKQLKWGAELIGWKDRKPDGEWPGRVKRGYGVGVCSWGNSPGQCEAEVIYYRSGRVEVICGIQDIGTGASSMLIDVVANHLGVDRSRITGKLGNSQYPPGPASGGSFTSRATAPALVDATEKATDKLRKTVAKAWQVKEEQVTFAKGAFSDGKRELPFAKACELISGEKLSARGEFTDKYYGEGDSDGVQFAIVDVDTETGIVSVKKVIAIQAMGKPMNRLNAENQINGGVIQGISYALFEDRILDRRSGSQLNAEFVNYKIAGPKDVPEIIPVFDVTDEDTGVRSLGEPATIPTCGAIANAVANATGARVRDMPITPMRILAALEAKSTTKGEPA